MNYWLLKSEPATWSWKSQCARGDLGELWDGVRNYQARNHMQAMQIGDQGFFYHSGDERAIVGIVQITETAQPDPTTQDPRWVCVRVQAQKSLIRPVTLGQIKSTPELREMVLVKNARLSVQPVSKSEWDLILGQGGL